MPAMAPPHPWEWPERLWARLHLDYAGPFLSQMFLLLVDDDSKWMEIIPVHAATSSATIKKLRILFATHGLSNRIVTDNGAVFTSDEIEGFLKTNGVTHTRQLQITLP